jgi:hypothetical protein
MYLLPLSFLAIRVSVTIILSGHSCIRYHYPFWLLMYSLPLSFLSVHVSVTIILSVHWCIHYHYPFCSLMYPLSLSFLFIDVSVTIILSGQWFFFFVAIVLLPLFELCTRGDLLILSECNSSNLLNRILFICLIPPLIWLNVRTLDTLIQMKRKIRFIILKKM